MSLPPKTVTMLKASSTGTKSRDRSMRVTKITSTTSSTEMATALSRRCTSAVA